MLQHVGGYAFIPVIKMVYQQRRLATVYLPHLN